MTNPWPATSTAATVPIEVQVTGQAPPDTAAYAEDRVRAALGVAHRPVLHARVRVTRHPDPSLERPVVASANVDVDGRFVRAQVAAPTAQEAVDLLHDRLQQRLRHDLQRAVGHWEDRRPRRAQGEPHEWRHGDERTHLLPYFPRPADERQIIPHTSVTAAPCDLDQAAFDMNVMDYDFHLFTEAGTGLDSVLYRAGPTGYRLAQVDPRPADMAPHSLEVTVSEQPAPTLSTAEAVDRMAVWDRPFLFFLDGDRGQGALLYHRYDGHYGLVNPAQPSHGGAV
ncbi:MAG: ribosome hibernation promotion factor [Blastococcus sp.]